MEPEDARLAIERHATSKIRRADDLGGDPHARVPRRGAAVDRLGVALRAADARARAPTAAPRSASTAASSRRSSRSAAPEGTVVEVNDLFYNLPARRKFLKSDGAESAQVSRIVTQLALAYPEVGFTLTSGGRTVLAVSAGRDRCAIGCISSTASATICSRCARRPAACGCTGFIAALAEQGPTRGPQNVFVNRRIVKDRTIAHAIIDAYSVASIKERSPEVHLFIEMPPDARRRQRAPDEGGGALPRAVAGARGGPPRR